MGKISSKCKIVLISLYSSDAIGLRYIVAFLKKHGFEVDLIFFKEKHLEADQLSMPTEKEYKLLIDLNIKLKPDLIGIGLRSSFFNIGSELTHRIKNEMDIPIIWGGTHATIAPDECIEIADMLCIGEGEYPMLDLATRISNGKSIKNIQNLWIKAGKTIKRNPIRELVEDLDSLPFPDYGDERKYFIEHDTVSSVDPALEAFNLDVMASRGCPYQCTYCCNSIIKEINKGHGPVVRRRSVDNVIEEIEVVRKKFKNLQRIDFIDEVFAWDKVWSSEFNVKYRERINLPFQCAQHPNMVDEDTLRMLKEAGLERVSMGLQSGYASIRKEVYKRPVSDKVLIDAGRKIKDSGIVPTYDLIVDNPFETNEDKRKGLDLILQLRRPFHLRMFPLTYFPNTQLTQKALESKLISIEMVENFAERTHNKWFVTLDYPWSDFELFWISIYSLTSKMFVPKWMIRWFAGVLFLQKHPRVLAAIADTCNNVKLGSIAIKWILEGKTIGSIMRHTKGKQSHWLI